MCARVIILVVTGSQRPILFREARTYVAARRCFAGGLIDESGGLSGLCVGTPVYRPRRITFEFTHRGHNAQNSHWAKILGALVKVPFLIEIRTQVEQR